METITEQTFKLISRLIRNEFDNLDTDSFCVTEETEKLINAAREIGNEELALQIYQDSQY